MSDFDQLLLENTMLHSTVDALRKRITVLEQSAMIIGIIVRLLLRTNQGSVAVPSDIVADMAQHAAEYEIAIEAGEPPHGLIYRLIKTTLFPAP